MKFSDIDRKEWFKLQPYLDTCVIPVTGLDGTEEPWKAVQELEFLRSLLEFVEIPYKGRIVTYPALHYVDYEADSSPMIEQVCGNLKRAGFRYTIVMAADWKAVPGELTQADLVLVPQETDGRAMNSESFKQLVDAKVQQLWRKEANNGEHADPS
ncbi:DUF2487 family protein [Paenibacillus koleovorans]|uniref:DUF2487 family protein n=1 Tax=Paenibacillus koleovorans TaxID=121608 RepID=UPI0013E2DC49|nr:DUF2487 family protein [Paenibacillus koleovorans]